MIGDADKFCCRLYMRAIAKSHHFLSLLFPDVDFTIEHELRAKFWRSLDTLLPFA